MKKVIFKISNKILKRNINYSEDIPIDYLLDVIFTRILMLVRGFFKKIFLKGRKSLFFCGSKVRIKCPGKISIGRGVTIKSGTKIDALSKNGICIGDNVSIGEDCIIICSGSISSIGKGIVIGNNTGIANDCFFGAAGGIEIGSDVVMGQNVRFHSENHEFSARDVLIKNQGVNHKGIRIGNNCWIGAGAVFLDGASVGDGCVVGANAVVNKAFHDNVIIVGMPAKVVKNR